MARVPKAGQSVRLARTLDLTVTGLCVNPCGDKVNERFREIWRGLSGERA